MKMGTNTIPYTDSHELSFFPIQINQLFLWIYQLKDFCLSESLLSLSRSVNVSFLL